MRSRRSVVKGLGLAGLGMIAACDEAGRSSEMPAREARRAGLAPTGLSPAETATIEALGEALLPGAAEAGIAHYVGHHLAIAPEQSLLMIRYMDVPPPWDGFYKGGLLALETLARERFGRGFAELGPGETNALVDAIAGAQPEGWRGPPAPLFYFLVRQDAVDVVYGTREGFERLGIAYVPHVTPERPW